jgi:hypothetical protein
MRSQASIYARPQLEFRGGHFDGSGLIRRLENAEPRGFFCAPGPSALAAVRASDPEGSLSIRLYDVFQADT